MLGPTRAATTLPLFLPQSPPDKATGLIHDATLLTQVLGQRLPRTRSGGRTLGSRAFRAATEAAFGGTDAEGVWVRKDAYEALEAAQVLFLRKFGTAMRSRRAAPRWTTPRRRARVADAPLGGSRALPAILASDCAWLCCRRGGSVDRGRFRARTVGRHRLARDLRQIGEIAAHPERDRRHPLRAARPPVPRYRGGPAQRRADPTTI